MKVHITKKAKKRIKALNSMLGKKIKQRLNEIDAAETLEDINLPATRLHKLSGDRKNQCAVKLNKNYRLVFTTEPEEFENYIEVTEITIIDCADYHKQ